MGYYIETEGVKGKAQALVDLHEAEILAQAPDTFDDVPEDKALICVVDNGPFEAATMFGAFEKVANELAAVAVSRQGFDALIEELFPTPADDATDAVKTRVTNNRTLLAEAVVEERKLLAAPDMMNYWTVLNGVTRFVDHAQKVHLRGREASEARFENSFLGRGATFKEKAAAKIIDLARAG